MRLRPSAFCVICSQCSQCSQGLRSARVFTFHRGGRLQRLHWLHTCGSGRAWTSAGSTGRRAPGPACSLGAAQSDQAHWLQTKDRRTKTTEWFRIGSNQAKSSALCVSVTGVARVAGSRAFSQFTAEAGYNGYIGYKPVNKDVLEQAPCRNRQCIRCFRRTRAVTCRRAGWRQWLQRGDGESVCARVASARPASSADRAGRPSDRGEAPCRRRARAGGCLTAVLDGGRRQR